MTFISYNITESDYLFQKILEYLSSQLNTILFLQEVKPDLKIDPKIHNVVEPTGQNIMYDLRIFASSDLSRESMKCASFERFQVLETQNGNFINVHMPSSWRSESDAFLKYSNVAKKVREQYVFELVGGDMNANPFEEVAVSPIAWFAKRSLDDFTQKKDEGLINPFWKISYIGMENRAKGSYPGRNKDFSKRQILDQFFVSPFKCQNVVECGIMENLFGESFEIINNKDEVKSTKGQGKLHYPVFIKYKVGN